MNKILFAIIVCVFSISAMACPDHDETKGKKGKPAEERTLSIQS